MVLVSLPYQVLEGGLVQVALQGEVAEGLPGRLVGLHLHRVTRGRAVVADRAARHQGRPRHALQVLGEEEGERVFNITTKTVLSHSK